MDRSHLKEAESQAEAALKQIGKDVLNGLTQEEIVNKHAAHHGQVEVHRLLSLIARARELRNSKYYLLVLKAALWILILINIPAVFFYLQNPFTTVSGQLYFIFSHEILFVLALGLLYSHLSTAYYIISLLMLIGLAGNFSLLRDFLHLDFLSFPGLLSVLMIVCLVAGFILSAIISFRFPPVAVKTGHLLEQLSADR